MKAFFALAALVAGAEAWVLPGTAARQFKDGAPVELKVNKITSPKTHLGYEHYSLKFCRVRVKCPEAPPGVSV